MRIFCFRQWHTMWVKIFYLVNMKSEKLSQLAVEAAHMGQTVHHQAG